VLAERAAELGVEVRRGAEVTGLAQDEEPVTIAIRGQEPVDPWTAVVAVVSWAWNASPLS
jgi:flavin-dependent dehydrogenase